MQNSTILSGYVRFRPRNKTYYLIINSRIFGRYLSNLNNKIKVKVNREGNEFIVKKDDNGNLLKGEIKGPITCISKQLIYEKEQLKIKNGDKNSFTCKIIINPEEFSLSKYDLYPDRDAADLAQNLELLGMSLRKRIFTSSSSDHDLEVGIKDKEALVEITRTKLSPNKSSNFKHQPTGGNIRAHIFDIYRKCVSKKKNVGFVIISEEWKNTKHIIDILNDCKSVGCNILFTDFLNKNWARKTAKTIIKSI